jgi:hypothetical protein
MHKKRLGEATERFHSVRQPDFLLNGTAKYVPTLSIGFLGKNITIPTPPMPMQPIF